MQISILDAKHPTYDAETWREYDALYRGGKAFRHCIGSFLKPNPEEPATVYGMRKEEARYCNYTGPIVDFYASKLLAKAPIVRARDRVTNAEVALDPFYAAWKEDVDRGGTDLVDFIRERFVAASVKGRSWWRVEMPDDDDRPAVNRAEWDARGLGAARVCPLENEQVFDWELDESNRLLWAIVHSTETRRESPTQSRSVVVETWQVFDREYVETLEARYDPGQSQPRPETATSVRKRKHGFTSVPLVALGFVGTRGVRLKVGMRHVCVSPAALEGFWLLNRLADPQIAHFRMEAALDWNIKRTCYAMPVFSLKDREQPVMGAGYGIIISEGESVEWAAPPTDHLAATAERISAIKDEIYRISNQLAQGVDNNAATVGRSAESKATDAAATEVVLGVYGAICREAIERTYELLSDGRAEHAIAWSIEGLDSFSATNAADVIANALEVQTLDIPSPTLRREVMARVAEAMTPNLTQQTRDAIRKEIVDGVTAEETMREIATSKPTAATEPDGDEGDDAEPLAAE